VTGTAQPSPQWPPRPARSPPGRSGQG
jgi:hypothetical protein